MWPTSGKKKSNCGYYSQLKRKSSSIASSQRLTNYPQNNINPARRSRHLTFTTDKFKKGEGSSGNYCVWSFSTLQQPSTRQPRRIMNNLSQIWLSWCTMAGALFCHPTGQLTTQPQNRLRSRNHITTTCLTHLISLLCLTLNKVTAGLELIDSIKRGAVRLFNSIST